MSGTPPGLPVACPVDGTFSVGSPLQVLCMLKPCCRIDRTLPDMERISPHVTK